MAPGTSRQRKGEKEQQPRHERKGEERQQASQEKRKRKKSFKKKKETEGKRVDIARWRQGESRMSHGK